MTRCTSREPQDTSLRPALLRLARTIIFDRDEAEDAVQDALIRAWQAGPAHTDGERRLRRIVHNRCLDVRRLAPEPPDRLDWDIPDGRDGPEALAIKADVAARVREAVGALPAHHREVVVRYYYDGQSVEEIAKRLGIQPGTVQSRLWRARETLRRKLMGYV